MSSVSIWICLVVILILSWLVAEQGDIEEREKHPEDFAEKKKSKSFTDLE